MLLVGDSGVGKSCLLRRFADKDFDDNGTYVPTIGVEFRAVSNTIDDFRVKSIIWDTAGQERFRSITKSYFRGCQGALLVFDASNRDSFSNCERWLKDLRSGASDSVPVTLVANKSDEAIAVSKEEAAEFASERGLELCWEVSARTGQNVDRAFRSLQSRVLRNGQTESQQASNLPSGCAVPANADNKVAKIASDTAKSTGQFTSETEPAPDHIIKVILIGDSGVDVLQMFKDSSSCVAFNRAGARTAWNEGRQQCWWHHQWRD